MSYDPELERMLDEYGALKQKLAAIEAERESGVYALSQRMPEQLEKERQIKQMLSFLSHRQLSRHAEQLLQHQQQRTTRLGNSITVDTYDLDYVLAESLQQMWAGENPQAEYHDWVEAQGKIQNDLVADGATADEVDSRNNFILFLNDRETEMKRVMSLYASAAINGKGYYQEMARERFNFMQFKLSELRRLRTRTQQTIDHENVSEIEARREANTRHLRQRGEAVAGMVATGYTVAAMEKYMQDKVHGDEFENGVAGRIIQFRPPTHTQEESEERIAALEQFSQRQIILAARMGISKDELVRQSLEHGHADDIRERVGKRIGFEQSRFTRLMEERQMVHERQRA